MDGDALDAELDEEKEETVDFEALGRDLYAACKANRGSDAEALMLQGAPSTVCQDNWTSLHWAALHGNVELTESLITVGAAASYLAMKKAAAADAAEESEELEVQTEPRLVYTSPLHWAAFKGHARVVMALLQAGFSTNDVDEVGNTPLHLSSANSHAAAVRVLLEHGARTHMRNAFQNRPLDLATHLGVRNQLMASKAEGFQLTTAETEKLKDSVHAHSEAMEQELSNAMEAAAADPAAQLSRLENAIAAAKTLSITPRAVEDGEAQIQRILLDQDLSERIQEVAAQRPIVTQRAYVAHVNTLSKRIQQAHKLQASTTLITDAEALVRRCHAEYWLQMVVAKLGNVESATEVNLPQIERLDGAITKAKEAGSDDDLIARACALSTRMHSEVEVQRALDVVPVVRLPPVLAEDEDMPKDYWDEAEDLGHVEETEGFPLPPEDGEYVWVQSLAFQKVQEAFNRLHLVHEKAVAGAAYESLLVKSSAALAKMTKEIKVLAEKDEEDKALAIAAVEKQAKKLKKGKKKK